MSKKIILGITASVSIYKSCSLIRILKKEAHLIKVIMTPNSTKLISSQLLESLTQDKVYVDMFSNYQYSLEHISLAKWAEVSLIIPASANTLAKLAWGLADNLLTSTFLALPSSLPKILAPAMNTNMWKNPLTQRNVKILKECGFKIIPPKKGVLASGEVGEGALANLEDILKTLKPYL
ncbi:MAG TPA: phosphopantothenoylcysteine decarboxylase [Candidatus Omnitrophica bacterium]|nr:MAG: phosphopantothenoylcysteine decarboxylase [Candidatus Omnitrophota bacterium]RKY45001.1 MAG: phosphopantothenoylcysteine decarboxylase [Candidatus Omnitrophota bacterium]HEC69217.1 phosphopantothenoylcysteine decarboxylase [Candidatus Omnitrophota bacterium]